MSRLLKLSVLSLAASLVAIPASSSAFGASLFQGTFGADDQVGLFTFAADGSTDVIIQSYGYAGGTVDSTAIPTGGFAPVVFLFDDTGNEITSDSGGHCGTTGTDPVTANCDDPYVLEPLLTAGTYTLALAEWDNGPIDGFLADGFNQDGNPGFTCAEFGETGNFCDVTTALGTQRTGDYALTITGANGAMDITNATPEPGTLPLLLSGGFAGALLLQRLKR